MERPIVNPPIQKRCVPDGVATERVRFESISEVYRSGKVSEVERNLVNGSLGQRD